VEFESAYSRPKRVKEHDAGAKIEVARRKSHEKSCYAT
jgi:hypothetical protein